MSKEYTRSMSVLGALPIAGQIVLYDDFENILHWTKLIGTGDSIFELDPTLAKHGNQSLHLKTRTTGATTGDAIGAKRLIHLLPSKVMSFIGSFYYPDHVKINSILFLFVWHDFSRGFHAQCRFKPNVPRWDFYNSDGQFTEITSFASKLAINTWHFINLRVNFATQHYLSLQINHLITDLSANPINIIDPDTSDSDFSKTIQVDASQNNPCEIYIDDIIIHEL